MNTRQLITSSFCAALLFTGCARTRSISNSAYAPDPGCSPASRYSDAAFAYRGELSEFDVLAIDPHLSVTDADIQQALQSPAFGALRPGSSLLVVQSGAVFPDAAMVSALSDQFKVVPFSGVPGSSRVEGQGRGAYSRLLRLAAARAGSDTVLCYWGILESGQQDLRTKTVSWVPLAGWIVPDERQHMRIRLKLALIDVGSGRWTVLSPPAFEGRAISTRFSRGSSDQKQVEALKTQAYEASVRELITQFVR